MVGRAGAIPASCRIRARPRLGRAGARHHEVRRRLASDDAGHFLLISGVLLVIGFVLFSGALTQMGTIEERTEREQRGDLVAEVGDLVAAMDRAVNNFAVGGEVNATDFARLARAVETAAREHGARSGIFASVALWREIPVAALVKNDCRGYDPDASEGGVIVGWERDSLEHGVVGAVYEMYVSDGARSMRFDYFVQFKQCANLTISTHAAGWGSEIGIVKDLLASHAEPGVMNVTEEQDWREPVFLVIHPTILLDSYDIHRWNQPWNIENADGQVAKYVSRASPENWMRFELEPPPRMLPDHVLENVSVNVWASHNIAGPDQKLWLKIFYPQNSTEPAIQREVGPLTTTNQQFTLTLSDGPNGEPGWTLDEIVDSSWEFTVIGPHVPSREVYVDYFNMTGGIWTFSAYRMNVTLDWPAIPPVYTAHELLLRYALEPGTPDEGFHLMVRDKADPDGDWWLVHNMTDTSAEPDGIREFTYPAGPGDPPLPNDPEFRIVDTDHEDNWEPLDEDTLEIHLLRIVSTLDA